jgi:regulation of enolase protein 1 (concanavalin A-like superfamily)
MLRKSVLAVLCVLVLGPAWSALAGFDPSLVLYWPLDEGAGTVANDLSGHGNNGTLQGGPTWVTPGQIGAAMLRFPGSNSTYVSGPHIAFNNSSFTIAMWINPVVTASEIFFSQHTSAAANMSMHYRIGGAGVTDAPVRGVRMGFYSNDLDTPANVIQDNTWYHLTFWYDLAAQKRRIYINGVQVAEGTGTAAYQGTTGNTNIAHWDNASQPFNGMMDDVQIYLKALSDAEIKSLMLGLTDKSLADNAAPADGAADVPQDVALSWTQGEYPSAHDVYFGTTFADVNDASRTNPRDVLTSQGQAGTTFDPAALLAYGQTYYWRIDEVNQTPDATIHKGGVWSFTVEPYGYTVKPAAVTASSSQLGIGGPEKTIDGSGLDASDGHGTDATTMWLSMGTQPNWIQYEFDQVYKLHELKVWNSNQMIESFLGFGAKSVTIEYSTDGTTWSSLDNVPEFARAPGADGYAANTTVNLGGIEAKYVKLTINASWGGMAATGLSEVRFSYIPVQAREPQPATAAADVSVDTDLNWRPGRGVASHTVFFGTDANAVADGTVAGKTMADHAYTPGSLNLGTTYYWKVDEVNAVTYPGGLWSFTTQEFAVIDGFESYDDADNRLYDAWIDGYVDNSSGSTVGYLTAANGTFGETAIVHAGKQSMPFEYNNVAAPYYSEATRTFDTPQNWTANGADTVSLFFRGRGAGFIDRGNNAYTMSASGTDIWGTADQFRFAYKQLNGDGSITMRVDSIGNTNVWAKAGPMIRETLDAGAKNACFPVTPGSGVSFQWRDTASAASANSQTTGIVAPYWVRITRTGNVFKAESSPDGKTWTQQGTNTTVTMGATVYIGMAVTSHDAALTTMAEISNVSTTGAVTGSWQSVAIGATMPTNGPAPVYLTVEDKAGKKKTVVSDNPDASATAAWTSWQVPLSEFSAAGVNVAAVKKVTIGVGDPANPKAGAAGMLYFDDLGYGHPVP